MSQEKVQRQGGVDEIDDVLEENAEDFVRAYVQKGGQ
jgi:ubiquitin-like protein Pup